MKKCKIIIFIMILLFSIYKIIDNKNLDIKDNVYIVSQSEVREEESISNNISDEKDNQGKEQIKIENTNKKTITVFISGEVKNPGVVAIDAEKRLSDAVNELGGTTENADLNKVNLAMKLKDESHYIIPKIGDNSESHNKETFENNIENDLNDKNNLININAASIQELDALPGVGEATANKIVNYREEKGKFNSIEEIKNVNGIGDKKYEELKTLISIE
ncbi:helix-hairpin-helix domain-containing protein [Romboutsia ilealis]|uniref:helix-hairpin-helix domain-containing protein n=1 Tax=Romboutsia ilealis TaxID=1115758 RepID=UPI002731F466|nr:helix-hairpin-helix domain-containing protein [Romboutsia ilealis]